jgi:hypothetical protein
MIPNLIHPIPVVVQRQLAAATTYDARARQPVRQLWKKGQGPGTGTEESLVAQVHWNNDKRIGEPEPKPAGVEERTEGYLLFRIIDLITEGVVVENGDGSYDFGFQRGDKIVRVGRRRVNLYVTFFRDVASYPDQGGATLLEVNFSDRAPSSSAREA